MDKLKDVAKHGVHPSGDREIHRKTWKSDVKNMALRKNPDQNHLDQARNHQSAPLSALKDPDSFGPPPKHTAVGGSVPTTPTSPTTRQQPRVAGGWGAPVPAPRRRQEQEEEEEEKPPVPYRTDTTGLTTNNLPKPPARRTDGAPPPAPPPRHSSPASSALPPRPAQQPKPVMHEPGPTLPPRMNDHPDEFTPPAPPPYQEAAKAPQPAAPLLNQGAMNRLGQAGISVSALGIGNASHEAAPPSPSTSSQGHPGQLSELQQRFARMKAGPSANAAPTPATSSLVSSAAAAAAAHKKPPPPPPPKKPGLASETGSRPSTADGSNAPPPLPLSSKPRPA